MSANPDIPAVLPGGNNAESKDSEPPFRDGSEF